jgi:ParB-like chromosome segregation protein Spo0J
MALNELQRDLPSSAGIGTTSSLAVVPGPGQAQDLDTELIESLLNEIDFDPDNPHVHTEEELRALAASMAEIGLINYPLVYRDPTTRRLRLIAGEGRVRAKLLLGAKTIHVRCIKGTLSDTQRGDLAFIDNVLQDDSLRDPLMFGLACQDNMAKTGRSTRDLAKLLKNKDHSSIVRAVALVNKLTPDLHPLLRSGQIPRSVARVLTGLHPDAQKQRYFAKLYTEGTVKTGQALASAIKAAKNGNGHADSVACFSCMENGVKIAVTLPGQDLTVAEPALRSLLKNLRDHGGKGVEHFQAWLDKRARALQAAEKLQRAQEALDAHAS